MTVAAAAKKAKPRVDDPERWEVEITGEPISDDAIAGIARLLIDRAKRRLQAAGNNETEHKKRSA